MAVDALPAAGDGPAAKPSAAADQETDRVPSPAAGKKARPGIVSQLFRGIFRGSDDLEKKLQYLSKEEASVLARLKRRARASAKTARNVVVLSVALEVAAVSYAIMMTRALDLSWQMRAIRVLPMFLIPGLSAVIYRALVSFRRMLDNKDQRMLERLRAERQAKIDELKERTNYYTTQQLIQRYDLDPAAKAAAAKVLASKLGADSGLQVHVGDESNINASEGNSNDVELVQSTGLRNRKPSLARSHSIGISTAPQFMNEASYESGADGDETADQRVMEHYKGSGPSDGGWLARIAALLVGEDPTQCYALICGNCHMHNGLARKEDFPYITYYCPHCHVLNGSGQSEEHESGPSSGKATPNFPSDSNDAAGNMSSITGVEVSDSLTNVQEQPEVGEGRE